MKPVQAEPGRVFLFPAVPIFFRTAGLHRTRLLPQKTQYSLVSAETQTLNAPEMRIKQKTPEQIKNRRFLRRSASAPSAGNKTWHPDQNLLRRRAERRCFLKM